MRLLRHWSGENWAILSNAGALIGTTGLNSALGFIYWWLAARLFAPSAVGLASAAISAMMLLGNVGMLGLGTLLIGELPHRSHEAGALIATALLVAGGASAVLGILFGLAAPLVSAELTPLAQTP
jgi:O-antigen/teichoic acid export membrane protein